MKATAWMIAGVMACTLCIQASAQSAAPPAGSNDTIPEKVARGAAPSTDVDKQGGSLSEKLSTTNGIIHPDSGVDPKMEKDAPPSGTMPVVPPPGSPGGSPDVQPK